MKTILRFLLCLFCAFACTDYDLNTASNEGLINVELSLNIDFDSTMGRVASFDHIFQGAMTLTFMSTTSDYTRSVNFDPNDMTSFPETLLPYDTYSWSVANDGTGVTISERLFIYGNSSEDFTVNSASTTLSLALDTDFALITVEQTNLASVTVTQGSISTPIYKKDGYFYAYLNSNKSGYTLMVETVDGTSGSVEIVSPIASTHYKANLSFGSTANLEIGIAEFTTESIDLVMDVPVTYPIVSEVSVPVSFNNEITIQNIKILTHENGYFTVRCGMLDDGATFVYDNKTYIVAVDQSTVLAYSEYGDDYCACTSKVTDMSLMFYQPTQPIGDISSWDVSNVTDMNNMFGLTNYVPEISHWDVSSVEYMYGMFSFSLFNQDISNWDVGSLIRADFMFYSNSRFDQDLSSWDVSNVVNMSSMFSGTDAFNQPIGSWNVSNVVDMSYMFYEAELFNQDIGNWDVSSVELMNNMFANAPLFDQDIGNWDVNNVTNMKSMFRNTIFNQDLTAWVVNNVVSCSSFQSNMDVEYMPNFTNCSPD